MTKALILLAPAIYSFGLTLFYRSARLRSKEEAPDSRTVTERRAAINRMPESRERRRAEIGLRLLTPGYAHSRERIYLLVSICFLISSVAVLVSSVISR